MRNSIFLILFVFLTLGSCKHVPDTVSKAVASDAPTAQLFQTEKTLVSAHRGGSGIMGYPENALETITYLHEQGITIFEIDVFQTSDDQLMLLHDNHLERTTTGNGSLKNKTAQDLQKLNLVDDFGKPTNYKIPFLKDVLTWAKANDAILMIDFKNSAKYEKVIALIHQTHTEDNCVLISYNIKQAKKLNRLAPNMLLSLSARNEKELDWMLESGIPTEKMIAFTGTKLSDTNLYKRLNDLKIPAILGTLGNLDKRAAARNENMYQKWADLGIQIMATDRPLDAYQALK